MIDEKRLNYLLEICPYSKIILENLESEKEINNITGFKLLEQLLQEDREEKYIKTIKQNNLGTSNGNDRTAFFEFIQEKNQAYSDYEILFRLGLSTKKQLIISYYFNKMIDAKYELSMLYTWFDPSAYKDNSDILKNYIRELANAADKYNYPNGYDIILENLKDKIDFNIYEIIDVIGKKIK